MGQRAQAIMYGVPEIKGVDFYGEDGDGGLVGGYRDARADDIAAYERKHPRKSWRDPDAEDLFIPQEPYESPIPVAGFYVACAGSGKAGVPFLEPTAVDDIATTYADSYAAAVKRWDAFAAWCAEQGVTLPPARLYLTETETA
jgi:hypothetical protein